VEAKEKALLVLEEAWYPGWRAEIDGRAVVCVAANIWMRAVPVPAGRHQVRLYFHQNYLLPGLLISLASAGLLLAVVLARPARRAESGPNQPAGFEAPPAPATEENGGLKHGAQFRTARTRVFPMRWQLFRALVAGALLVGLAAMTGILRARSLNITALFCEAATHCRIAETLAMQGQTGQAITHYTEVLRLKPDFYQAMNNLAWIRATSAQAEFRDAPDAVRLAERACQLTGYMSPKYVGTLATALNNLARIWAASPRAELRHGPEAVGLAERACQLTGYKVPLYVQTLAAALNNLAWMRAASPQTELRDGPEAVRLAERACQLTDYEEAQMVGTLAAAYAEAGRFAEAVTTSEMESKLASARGDSGLAERTQKVTELYRARQPVRDADLRDEPLGVVPGPVSGP
jgi:tetratricopeptide (TPR) repeat protein